MIDSFERMIHIIISNSIGAIRFSEKDAEFNYFRVILSVLDPYIRKYKNVAYYRLTDKDKSIVLAKIIKSMNVNGVPVTTFFSDVIKSLNDLSNFEKNQMFIEFLAKEIFGCYDKNRNNNGEIYKTPYLFYINMDGEKDYFEPEKPSKLFIKLNKSKGQEADKLAIYDHFLDLKRKERFGVLSTQRVVTT